MRKTIQEQQLRVRDRNDAKFFAWFALLCAVFLVFLSGIVPLVAGTCIVLISVLVRACILDAMDE